MAVYLITTHNAGVADISKLISDSYPEKDRYNLLNGSWLVFEEDKVPNKAVFTKIFGEDADLSISSFITVVDSYYGIQNTAAWDWLNSKGL